MKRTLTLLALVAPLAAQSYGDGPAYGGSRTFSDGLSAKGMRSKIIPITLGKLVLHPLSVWLALTLAVLLGMPALPADLRTALLLTAALPIMSIYPILAMRHGHEKFCAAALLATTALSFFSLSALLAAL